MKKANFPGAVSVLDGCNIPFDPKSPIQVPYRNYKKFYSFNLMAAALPDRSLFYGFCANFPGSDVHDSAVFQNSSLFQKLEDQGKQIFNPQTYHIIAEPAFPLKTWMIKPSKKFNGYLQPAKKDLK